LGISFYNEFLEEKNNENGKKEKANMFYNNMPSDSNEMETLKHINIISIYNCAYYLKENVFWAILKLHALDISYSYTVTYN